MFNRLSQLKQSLSEELEQVVAASKEQNDPISIIERNKSVLSMSTPSVEQMDFMAEGDRFSSQDLPDSADTPANESKTHASENSGSTAKATEVGPDANATISASDPAELEQKLRRLAKYEEKYPNLLKAYRLEKKKGDLVKIFEKILSEHTPCTTIAQPQEMVNYLDSLAAKNDMQQKELTRVSDAHSRLRKRYADLETELATARERPNVPPDTEGELQLLAAQERVTDLQDKLTAASIRISQLEPLEASNSAALAEIDTLKRDALRVPEFQERIKQLEELHTSDSKCNEDLAVASNKIKELEAKLHHEEGSLQEMTLTATTGNGGHAKGKKGKKGKGASNEASSGSPLNSRLQEFKTQVATLEKSLEAGKVRLVEQDAEIASLQTQIATKTEQIAALTTCSEDKADADAQQKGALEEKLKATSAKLAELSAVSHAQKKELDSLHQQRGDSDRSLIEAQDSLKKQTLQAEATEKELITLRQQASALELFRSREAEQTKKRNEAERRLEAVQTDLKKLEEAQQDHQRIGREAASNQRALVALQIERNELLVRVEQLETKVSSEAAASISAKLSQNSITRQLEEARSRLLEANTNVELLQDELAEAQRQAQERLQETVVIRTRATAREDSSEISLTEAQKTIRSLTEERDLLESEVQSLGKRLIRESDQLRKRIQELQAQLRASETLASESKTEIASISHKLLNLQTSESPAPTPLETANTETLRGLRQKLEDAERGNRDSARANALLKQTSEDALKRLERLQMSHRVLSDDLDRARREKDDLLALQRKETISTDSSNVRLSTNDAPAGDAEKRDAYVKNVILGFLEHKDQRKQLLPVISTLLKFQGSDEQRFWSALS